jgi:RsiG-like
VEPLPELGPLSDDELHELIGTLETREGELSRRRRLLHERIDLLRGERTQRLKVRVAAGTADLPVPDRLERPLYTGTGDLPDDVGIDALPDLSSLDDEDLRQTIRDLEREEDDVSLERRVVHAQIDIARVERQKRRNDGHVGPDDLGPILGGGGG